MTKVPQIKGESRKHYLARVAVIVLISSGFSIENFIYDEAECDAFCLADDMKIEFDIED
tara:strand:- start:44 stop:220 length:177 start_codon:yes stop_codon:yes gene_type:complete